MADLALSQLDSITESDDILGGRPVFRGTRVPIDTVLGSLDLGMSFEQVRESFPIITEELVATARRYLQFHPVRQPLSLGELNPNWKLINTKIIMPESQ